MTSKKTGKRGVWGFEHEDRFSEAESEDMFLRESNERAVREFESGGGRNAPSELGDKNVASGHGEGDRRDTGQGERRGRSTDVDRGTRRSPTIQPPTQRWTDRGRFAARSESVASRGEATRDAPSESKKRRNESAHDQERDSKALKRYDPSSQKRFDSMWTSGGLEVQKGRLDTITGVVALGGAREKPNMVSQFVGPMSGAFASKTTKGQGTDQEICVLGAHKMAEARSATGEVLSLHIPIQRNLEPTASTSGGRAAQTPQDGPRKLRLTQKPKNSPWSSSRTSSPAPWMRAITQGDKKDKVTEVVDLDTETAKVGATETDPVDLTAKPDEETMCDICRRRKCHTTGLCALVTSVAHGDTTTDPFCDISSSYPRKDAGQYMHALQGPQKGEFRIGCSVLRDFWEHGNLKLVFLKLVVGRRRKPPLAVTTEDFCFLRLAILVSSRYYNGEMPPELEGIWPYTKADAVKYQKECEQFWDIGMEKMPRGELEGLTMAEIRQAYEEGKISPQVRFDDKHMRRAALYPANLTRTTDGEGDTIMAEDRSSRLPRKAGTKRRVRKEDVLTAEELVAEAQDEQRAERRTVQPTGKRSSRVSRIIHGLGSDKDSAGPEHDETATGRPGKKRSSRMSRRIEGLGSDKDSEDSDAEEQASGGLGKSSRSLMSRRREELGSDEESAHSEAGEQASGGLGKSSRSLMSRRREDMGSDKDSADTEAEEQTTVPPLSRQGVDPEPEAGQDKPQEEQPDEDTLMGEAGEDDVIGIITKAADIPEAMFKALEVEFDEGKFDEKADLLDLYKRVRDAGQEKAKRTTQQQVYDHLHKKYDDGNLSQVLEEAWLNSLEDWGWVKNP